MQRRNFIRTTGVLSLLSPVDSIANFKKLTMDRQKICGTCGTQFPKNSTVDICTICAEERQYVPLSGQIWTNHDQILETHKNKIVKLNDNLFEIVIEPSFGIGQRAFLVLSKSGNVLWDCIPLLNKETIDFINSKGGIKAIAFSHPHYYSNMNDWAATFDCPIYIHNNDAPYIVDKGQNVILWDGKEKKLWDDLKLINLGGHFDGSSVMLIPSMSQKGVMLTGDTVYLSLSKKHFAIMYSYPNRIPLPLREIKRIKKRLVAIPFDTIYGFYSYQNVLGNAKELVMTSVERYLAS